MKNLKALILKHETLEFEEVELNGEEVTYKFLHEKLGCIEHLSGYNETLDKNRISMWCDEENKLKDGWEERIQVAIMKKGKILDVLAGDIIFSIDGPRGESYGLTDEQIKIVKDVLKRRIVPFAIEVPKWLRVLEFDA